MFFSRHIYGDETVLHCAVGDWWATMQRCSTWTRAGEAVLEMLIGYGGHVSLPTRTLHGTAWA